MAKRHKDEKVIRASSREDLSEQVLDWIARQFKPDSVGGVIQFCYGVDDSGEMVVGEFISRSTNIPRNGRPPTKLMYNEELRKALALAIKKLEEGDKGHTYTEYPDPMLVH